MKLMINGTEEKTLIEMLELQNIPSEQQREILDKAGEAIEINCIARIVRTFEGQQDKKDQLLKLLESQDQTQLEQFLSNNQVDLKTIFLEEVAKVKDSISSNV